MEETKEQPKFDLTQWNRKDRRTLVTRGKLLGRNLPYVKAIHGSLENYYTLRAKEIEADVKEAS